MLDELRDIVEERPWLQIANIAGRATLKDCCWATARRLASLRAPRFIDDRAEGPPTLRASALSLATIVIRGDRRLHALTLLPRHYHVNRRGGW
jgi:hypothetical protein